MKRMNHGEGDRPLHVVDRGHERPATAATQSFALVMIDDSIDFVHWVAFDLPPETTSLPEGASDQGLLPAGTREANAYCVQYCGPCPPNTHTYTFRLYALDVPMIDFSYSGSFGDAELGAAFGASSGSPP